MNKPKKDNQVTCSQCGGRGYTDEEHEPPCDLCMGEGIVDYETADYYESRPLEPTEYWWNNEGYMVEVDND